jgi:hypothetical protein
LCCVLFSPAFLRMLNLLGRENIRKFFPQNLTATLSLLRQDHSGIRWNVGRMLQLHSSIRFFGVFLFPNSLSLVFFWFYFLDWRAHRRIPWMYVRKLAESGSRTQFLSTSQTTHKVPPLRNKKCHQHFFFQFHFLTYR